MLFQVVREYYFYVLSCHHMFYTFQLYKKFEFDACFIILLVKPCCYTLNPFFCKFVGSLNVSCCQPTAMERLNGETIRFVLRCLVILYCLSVNLFFLNLEDNAIYLHKAIPYYHSVIANFFLFFHFSVGFFCLSQLIGRADD